MELQENQMAANTEEIANPQEDVNQEQQDNLDNQDDQALDNNQEDVTQTQAFAHRLKEATSKTRDEVIAELFGEQGINTYDDYLREKAAYEEEQRRKYYQEQGVDPDLINQAIEEHPDVKYAREMRAKAEQDARFQTEVNQLLQEFPNLKPTDIPQEVFDLNKQGVPLLYAYKSATYGQVKSQAEQETIRKLQANATSSPGSLSQGTEHTTGISNMSQKDFNELVQAVLRGERKTL